MRPAEVAHERDLQERLGAYCRRELGAPNLRVVGMRPIPEGHSGLTYFVDIEGGPEQRYVLRLPPAGSRPVGPADVVRQGRIMAALHGEGVAVPRVILNSDGATTDGQPLLLVEAIDGDRAEIAVKDHASMDLAAVTVEVLKQIHAVPVPRTGIADEDPMSLDEEVGRWERLITRAPSELVVFGSQLTDRLRDRRPPESPPTLVHGDFTFGNVLYRDGRVAAVIDWEIAQLGQPLIDLGSLCTVAKRKEFPLDPNPSGSVNADPTWLMEQYGGDPTVTKWYVALSYFKYAAIQAYNLGLHRSGKRPDPIYDLLPETIEGLQRGAMQLLYDI